MRQKHQTRPNKGRAGCAMLPGDTQNSLTVSAYRAQHLAARYALPLEAAAIVAALAFGGGHG